MPCLEQAGHTGCQQPRRRQTCRYSVLAELVELISDVLATDIGTALVDSAPIPVNVQQALPRQLPEYYASHD
jgi:hypothetical protein